MLMKKIIFLLPFVILWASCSSDEPIPDNPKPVTFELSAAESRAAEQTLGFNIDFFRAVCHTEKASGTISTSPLSATLLLSMIANACDAEMSRQITDALGCKDIDALNSLAQKYLLAMPEIDPSVSMGIANSIWYHNSYTLSKDFADIIDRYYDGGKYGRNLQSGDEAIASEINNWASDKTKGLITNIVSSADLNSGVVILMANAIYFNGLWANPFEKENTAKKDFFGLSKTVNIDMMQSGGMQHYAETEELQAVKMEFGDGSFEAIIVLPAADAEINSFIASDALDKLATLRYNDQPIEFSLPKLKIAAQKLSLNKPLQNLGITNIGNIQNYKMFSEKVTARSEIHQKATIEFTEQGAEGAGVTWDNGFTDPGPDAPAPAKPVMNVNRPFVFFINETTTGACLFATRVTDL